jgi:hypothetical protein
MQLITRNPKRLFAFGCSFTNYFWTTWPEIIAYDLDIPYYNYGQSGGGNLYMSNMVCQADSIHNFNENDLIIICWTNVAREDRWVNGQWITPGNIYTQEIYDNKFIEKWSDPMGYLIRDLALIKLTKTLLSLKGCQFHFLAMCDILNLFNQNSNMTSIPENLKPNYEKLLTLYKDEIEFIQPSFFKILWNNDLQNHKFVPDESKGFTYFKDGHPYPDEHFRYLKKVFDEHVFDKKTILKICEVQKKFTDFIKERSQEFKRYWAIYELSHEYNCILRESVGIKSSEFIERI